MPFGFDMGGYEMTGHRALFPDIIASLVWIYENAIGEDDDSYVITIFGRIFRATTIADTGNYRKAVSIVYDLLKDKSFYKLNSNYRSRFFDPLYNMMVHFYDFSKCHGEIIGSQELWDMWYELDKNYMSAPRIT